MANNTRIQSPTRLGDLISTEDIDGVKIPRSKLCIGEYGEDDGDISSANPMPVSLESYPKTVTYTSNNYNESDEGDVIILMSGSAGVIHNIGGVCWSYSTIGEEVGSLTIKNGGTTVFSIDITASGPGFVTFDVPLSSTSGSSLNITLSYVTGATCKLSILGYWTKTV